jgi:hypothetical protein
MNMARWGKKSLKADLSANQVQRNEDTVPAIPSHCNARRNVITMRICRKPSQQSA